MEIYRPNAALPWYGETKPWREEIVLICESGDILGLNKIQLFIWKSCEWRNCRKKNAGSRTRGSYSEVASFSVGALECWEMGKTEKETKEDCKPVIESYQLLLKTFHELVTDGCFASSALFLWHTNALVPGPECSLWCFLREFFWGNTEEQEMVSF